MTVFQMNDYDWWMADTLDQAKVDYLNTFGPPDEGMLDNPRELTGDKLDAIKFQDEGGERFTFREELARRIAEGRKSEFFASTEY